MRMFRVTVFFLLCAGTSAVATADSGLLKAHCQQCHSGDAAAGEFLIASLGATPTEGTARLWEDSLDYVRAGDMPPAEESRRTSGERARLVPGLEQGLRVYNQSRTASRRIPPRRRNNREFENSVRDVLQIEDVGTHLPTDQLIGDALHHGFDTHGETLGFSRFHLEQYVAAVRRIVDATILTSPQPAARTYHIRPTQVFEAHTSQNTTRPERKGRREAYDFLDPQRPARLAAFSETPHTGWYRIRIRCTGRDRGRYPTAETGIYADDPIRLRVEMGERQRTFDLPDDEVVELELNEWLAAGTRLRLRHPTDGLRMKGNGNFKFQNAITGRYLEQHDPQRFAQVLAANGGKRNGQRRSPYDWHNWVDDWMGPRPQILGVEISGPHYRSWPPERQVALLGAEPEVADAERLLRPIAERAWGRSVQPGELDQIIGLVRQLAASQGDVEGLKEGIVAILVSPPFLLVNQSALTDEERFTAKVARLLHSSIASERLQSVVAGWHTRDDIRRDLPQLLQPAAPATSDPPIPFLTAFPIAWLQLNDINFMAPDPDQFRFYHRKRVSEDMVSEVLRFFEDAVARNVPIPDLLTADYSFVNADLAHVYGLSDVRPDSTFRRYDFADGRRGGLLGMGAFLTITADSLSTSPIHRAVYVMENFLGRHPDPPPPDVDIQEPDVRSAETIREILQAHRSDQSCASCHQSIDPYGYAFENFDSMGAWRDVYLPGGQASAEKASQRERADREQPLGIPIDASAAFRNGTQYQDIRDFRAVMRQPGNQRRFVRCFVVKLLTYANGAEPTDSTAVDRIVSLSAAHDYRMVETLAAVIDSPLFRETD